MLKGKDATAQPRAWGWAPARICVSALCDDAGLSARRAAGRGGHPHAAAVHREHRRAAEAGAGAHAGHRLARPQGLPARVGRRRQRRQRQRHGGGRRRCAARMAQARVGRRFTAAERACRRASPTPPHHPSATPPHSASAVGECEASTQGCTGGSATIGLGLAMPAVLI